jgi:hypothetical protein
MAVYVACGWAVRGRVSAGAGSFARNFKRNRPGYNRRRGRLLLAVQRYWVGMAMTSPNVVRALRCGELVFRHRYDSAVFAFDERAMAIMGLDGGTWAGPCHFVFGYGPNRKIRPEVALGKCCAGVCRSDADGAHLQRYRIFEDRKKP